MLHSFLGDRKSPDSFFLSNPLRIAIAFRTMAKSFERSDFSCRRLLKLCFMSCCDVAFVNSLLYDLTACLKISVTDLPTWWWRPPRLKSVMPPSPAHGRRRRFSV